MKFIYSCIGSNTPENREHLEKLGYEVLSLFSLPYIATSVSGHAIVTDFNRDGGISCIGNDALFRAVTAMRDDSNYLQLFVDPVGCWHYNPISMDGLRKATLSELQEHFK